MQHKNDSIAVFDSGVGGISVLRELLPIMPNERYLYFGDSANAPYGVRPVEEVQQLFLNAAEKLIAQNIKAMVIACNTATSVAKEILQRKYPELIIVGIQPPILQAAQQFPGKVIGVMATPVAIRSRKITALLDAYAEVSHFIPLPTPGLVDLVESGKGNSPESEELLRELLAPYIGKLDALILGCTHYPFAVETIKRLVGDDLPLIDGAPYTAREAKRRIAEAGLLGDGSGDIVIQNSSTDPAMIARSWELLRA